MKFNSISKLIIIILLVLFGIFEIMYARNHYPVQKEHLTQTSPNYYEKKEAPIETPEPTTESAKPEEAVKEIQPTPEIKKETIPEKTYLNVPFMVQAPGANWDTIHEEACEEASLAMLYHYIKDTTITDPNKDLDSMLEYENQHDYGASITLDQLNEIAKNYYGLKSGRIEKNITSEKIKKELADGKPVIVGAAGKILPNPNFRNGGPNYHMLVIIGYDGKGFITNDPGTRKGKDFRYTENALYNAIHDWNPQDILKGERNYFVID